MQHIAQPFGPGDIVIVADDDDGRRKADSLMTSPA
jgi:hypothetical protein